jgi:hypothetical protein
MMTKRWRVELSRHYEQCPDKDADPDDEHGERARESVNRCLREWQRTAMVRADGTSIAILDAAPLKRISEQGRGPA